MTLSTTTSNGGKALAPQENPPVGGKNDIERSYNNGPMRMWLDRTTFEQAFSAANMLAMSTIVPEHYQGNPGNCFIAINLAERLNVDPFMLMQNSHVIHGKPGFEAKFIIAMVNMSGLFKDPLEYELSGKPNTAEWSVRVSAVRVSTGKECVLDFSYKTAIDEGWVNKAGSKWKTMGDQMMRYRGAAFFCRVFCPEVMMGLQTTDELIDVGANSTTNTKQFDDTRSKSEQLLEQLNGTDKKTNEPPTTPKPETTTAEEPVTGGDGEMFAHDIAVEIIGENADVDEDSANAIFEKWCQINKVEPLGDMTIGDPKWEEIEVSLKKIKNWKLYEPSE